MRILLFLLLAAVFANNNEEQDYLVLSNGVKMPRVGFGLAAMRGETTRESVREHVKLGFKLLDGAEATEWYDDESAGSEVGNVAKREDVFLVSKIHPINLSFERTLQSVEKMLKTWNNTQYMDLVLLHYPACGAWIPNCGKKVGGDWLGAFRALEQLVHQGKIRALGVSNFHHEQLDALYAAVSNNNTLHVLQDWIDPFHQNNELLQWANERNIKVTAYSTFGVQWETLIGRNLVAESKVLRRIAEKRNAPVSSVVLAWLIARKNVAVIPRSTRKEHIASNAAFLNPAYAQELLTAEDMDEIDSLDGMFDSADESVCRNAKPPSKLCVKKCRATCAGKEW